MINSFVECRYCVDVAVLLHFFRFFCLPKSKQLLNGQKTNNNFGLQEDRIDQFFLLLYFLFPPQRCYMFDLIDKLEGKLMTQLCFLVWFCIQTKHFTFSLGNVYLFYYITFM